MGVLSTVSGVSTIVLWPLAVVNAVEGGSTIEGAVGLVAGLGITFYFFGSPIPYVQAQDFISLGFGYGLTGAVYWASTEVYNKFDKST